MLSDFYPHGEVAKQYGIFNEKQGTAFRTVIVIDKQGIVRFKQTYTSAADIDVEDILAEVDLLQT
jgi:alkyl hydroperoxide reductase subunit AhpC